MHSLIFSSEVSRRQIFLISLYNSLCITLHIGNALFFLLLIVGLLLQDAVLRLNLLVEEALARGKGLSEEGKGS